MSTAKVLKASSYSFTFGSSLQGTSTFEGIIESIENPMLWVDAAESPPVGYMVNFTISSNKAPILNGTAKIQAIVELENKRKQLELKLVQVDSKSLASFMERFAERQNEIASWMGNLKDE